jgi:hypothetical protein
MHQLVKWYQPKILGLTQNIFVLAEIHYWQTTEKERSMTTFYYCSVNHQSGLQRNTFSKLSYIFFNTSKCVANYVISFELYDDFIGQQILKL